jgi:tRNA(Ile)-lysidine synthase
MFNLEKLRNNLLRLTHSNKLLVAYSGGMDSHVLLHSLQSLNFELRAVHIHHGLSENADLWVEHCHKVCVDLEIEFIVKYINIKIGKHSPEAIARELRYDEFKKLLSKGECLVTAHHADDQVETLLLQLFRGSGPKGLAAMPERKGFTHGDLLRPLLEFSRAELHQYAQQNNLKWIEDESNENIGIDRNFVRHKLMPLIKKKWPGTLKTLSRSAEHCAEAGELLVILAEQDYANIQGSKPNTLSIRKLLALNPARQNNVIRYWLHKLNFPTPSSIKLKHIKTDILNCRIDANPVVNWPGTEIRRYRDDLYVMLPLKKTIKIQAGRKARKIFQEKGIPPWERDAGLLR